VPTLFIYPKKRDAFDYVLGSEKITLGRASTNAIVLFDEFSSGCHAAIFPVETGYVIEDQASKNGTFLNGRRLSKDALLKKGDEILIGSTRIVFDSRLQTDLEIVDDGETMPSTATVVEVKELLKPFAARAAIDTGAPRIQGEQKFIAALSEMSQALICQVSLDKLLGQIMDLVSQNAPMDRGVLLLKAGGTDELVPQVVRTAEALSGPQEFPISRSIFRTALSKSSAILIPDVSAEERLSAQHSLAAAQVHSAMCVPLWNNQEIIGLIYCDRTRLPAPFSEEDLRLVTLLANLAAVKIQNVRLFEEAREKALMEQELVMAERIQRNFLPKNDPVFQPYEISGSAVPCRHVGGDYFDFIQIDPFRLGIVIADVSGHGVSAALLMASLRASLQAAVPGMNDIVSLAGKLNAMLCRDSESHKFISFFFGILDRTQNEIRFVNAGHNPPLLVDAAGGSRELGGTGLCLGMFPSASYGMMSMAIQPGEILCLFTDGIVESRNPDKEEFGDERLIELIHEARDLPVRGIIDKVFENISGFTHYADPADDMTIIAIKRKALV